MNDIGNYYLVVCHVFPVHLLWATTKLPLGVTGKILKTINLLKHN